MALFLGGETCSGKENKEELLYWSALKIRAQRRAPWRKLRAACVAATPMSCTSAATAHDAWAVPLEEKPRRIIGKAAQRSPRKHDARRFALRNELEATLACAPRSRATLRTLRT